MVTQQESGRASLQPKLRLLSNLVLFQFASWPLKWLLLCESTCYASATPSPTHQPRTHPSVWTQPDIQRIFNNCLLNEWTNVTDHLLKSPWEHTSFSTFWRVEASFLPSSLGPLKTSGGRSSPQTLVSVPQPTINGRLTSISYKTLWLFFLFRLKSQDP